MSLVVLALALFGRCQAHPENVETPADEHQQDAGEERLHGVAPSTRVAVSITAGSM